MTLLLFCPLPSLLLSDQGVFWENNSITYGITHTHTHTHTSISHTHTHTGLNNHSLAYLSVTLSTLYVFDRPPQWDRRRNKGCQQRDGRNSYRHRNPQTLQKTGHTGDTVNLHPIQTHMYRTTMSTLRQIQIYRTICQIHRYKPKYTNQTVTSTPYKHQ